MSVGQKIIVTVGAFVITFIVACAIMKNDISFILTSRSVERHYGKTTENNYFIEDNFEFVDNHEEAEVSSKEDIINSIYYLLNSGVTFSKRYCAKDYDDCYKDMDEISSDTDMLSILNNCVHPYNSFDSIIFNFDNNVIEVEIKHTYTEEQIKVLNEKIDNFINENDLDTMSPREQIKVVHDYIINNTEYDQLKSDDVQNNMYKSNTAYGVLVQRFGICSGYSDAMKLFLDKLNIINYKISNDQHIWNLVLLNEEWLHLDLTWDDPISDKNITRDNYFLISNKTMKLLDDGVHYFDSNIFSDIK